MCVELYLTEGIVARGESALLLDPCGGAVGRYDGDLVRTRRGGEDVSVRPDDVRQLKTGNEALLELVGNKVAAL